MKVVNPEIHAKPGNTLHVKPVSIALTLDSLAAVSGRTDELNRSFTIGLGTEDWKVISIMSWRYYVTHQIAASCERQKCRSRFIHRSCIVVDS